MILKEREQELISKYFEYNFKINVPLNTESHISQSLVINEYQEIIKEILCPICTEIPLNPVKCSNCGNILCEECEKKINKCPFNCPNFKFLHLDRIFKNVLNLLKTKCYFNEKGCDKILYFKDYLNHIKNCDYAEFYCTIEGCNFKGNKNECFKHIFLCGLGIMKCKFCKRKCFKFQLKEYEEYCGNLEINCKLCGQRLLNKNLENHNINECDFSQVKCQQCNKIMFRKEFKTHDINKCLEYQVEYWKNLSNKKDITIKLMKEELENVKEGLNSERHLIRDISVKNMSSGFNLFNDRYDDNNDDNNDNNTNN